MNIENKTRGMIEAAMMVTLTSVFAVMGTYIPLLTFILFFIPVPFIILAKRRGLSFTLLGVVVASILIGMLTEPVHALFVVSLPGIIAIVIGYMMNKNYSPGKIFLGGTLAGLVSITITAQLGAIITGINVIDSITEMFKQSGDMVLSLYKTSGVANEQIQKIESNLDKIMEMVMITIPAAFIISSAFSSYINYSVASKVLKRVSKEDVSELPALRYVTLPKNIVMGSFLILALTYIK